MLRSLLPHLDSCPHRTPSLHTRAIHSSHAHTFPPRRPRLFKSALILTSHFYSSSSFLSISDPTPRVKALPHGHHNLQYHSMLFSQFQNVSMTTSPSTTSHLPTSCFCQPSTPSQPTSNVRFLSSLYDALDAEEAADKKKVMMIWLTETLTRKLGESVPTPGQILYHLAGILATGAEEHMMSKAEEAAAAVTARAVAKAVKEAKKEALKAQQEAVKDALATVGLCVVA